VKLPEIPPLPPRIGPRLTGALPDRFSRRIARRGICRGGVLRDNSAQWARPMDCISTALAAFCSAAPRFSNRRGAGGR